MSAAEVSGKAKYSYRLSIVPEQAKEVPEELDEKEIQAFVNSILRVDPKKHEGKPDDSMSLASSLLIP